MKWWVWDVLDLLYPRICPGCGMPLRRKERIICLFCLLKLPRTLFKCRSDNVFEKMLKGRVRIFEASAFLYFAKSGLAQRLMHALKYGGDKALGIQLGRFFAEELIKDEQFIKPDLLVSVPLHPDKLSKRGYNQSEMIALGLSEKLGVPYRNDVLVRVRHTETQTRKKRFERWENMKDGFGVEASAGLNKVHIAIVDDVVTTGATLEVCAETLHAHLECEVSLFTLCIAIR